MLVTYVSAAANSAMPPPDGLREAGIDVVALAERYGVPQDERITYVEWMREAAEHGEAVLMCDDAIRKKNPKERRVLLEVALQAFVVSSQLPAAEVVRRFVVSVAAIERACRRPGPFVYRLHPDRIERRQIKP
jgi:endonuclease/exonuclease/phosphatase family metal-dependent hydrolase